MRAAALALALTIGGPLAAAECRLALVLALDVSSSVDAQEDALQRRGLAAYEWSGRYNQETIADWRLIRDRSDLLALAGTIGRSERSHNEVPTAMGYALGYGAGLLARGPDCLHRTLDMAGDGENNEGFPPASAYAEFPFAGVTVNGLVVSTPADGAEIDLVAYYSDHVLHGPGAFLEVAQGFDDYERAMRRKLLRELRPRAVGALPRPQPGAPG